MDQPIAAANALGETTRVTSPPQHTDEAITRAPPALSQAPECEDAACEPKKH
jgi:hypothetical protein